MESAACSIDDFGPVAVVQPQTTAEIGEFIRQAAKEGRAVYPLGGRTQLGLGLPPTRPGVGIDLRALTQVIDYPARDMTITVQAGITLAELQRLLATERQRLPIDVPQAAQATLGGAIATNASGPRRFAAGTLRDYVIGISVVNDEGQETKAGGRVVKNVAGYDLCKLHIGALGTLGIVSQVTLKLRPLPEAQAILTAGCQAPQLSSLLDLLHKSRTRPVALDLLNAVAVTAVRDEAGVRMPEAPWVVAIGFEDCEGSVTWQVQELIKELASAGARGVEARAGAASQPLWQALTELTLRPSATLSFKANMVPSAVASFCQAATTLPGILLHVHAGSGIVRGHVQTALTADQFAEMLKPLQDAAAQAHGNLILTQCPPDSKRLLPVWGKPRGDAWLMRQVKDKLDPRHLFNPGRFLDGI